jgi:hypothetical protein
MLRGVAKPNERLWADVSPRLVQVTRYPASYDVRLRRLLCGKASPFRGTTVLVNLLHAGWKAQPSSLRGEGRKA